jgi:hypothetical protein
VSFRTIHQGLLSAAGVSALVLASPALARPPKPVVTSFSPKRAPYGAKVTIVGSHLARATILFNGIQAASVTVNRSGTRVTATVPVPEDADEGVTGPIGVTTPGGATQTHARFTLVQPKVAPVAYPRPRIVGFTPPQGKPGTRVTVTGEGFGGATAVTLAGVKAIYTVPTEMKIVMTVPAHAKSGKISITTVGGTATSSSSFRVG